MSASPVAVLGRRLTGAVAGERLWRSARRDVGLAGLALGLLALAMAAPHVGRGGFYYDDWAALSIVRFAGHGGVLPSLWQYYGSRPGQVVYYGFLESALGYHAQLQLALAALLVAAEATFLFALLGRLGLARRHSASIAALVVVFPFSDSLWLWPIMSMATLSIAMSLVGVLLALRAFSLRGPAAVATHAASVALYVAGVLSYEVFAVAGCLVGGLYAWRVGWCRARLRWAVDVLAIVGTLAAVKLALPVDVATPSGGQSAGGMVDHAGSMAVAGLRLAGGALLPFAPGLAAGGVLAAVLGAACAVRGRSFVDDATRGALNRWLPTAGAGLAVAVAGWAVYVPASDHYLPVASGTVNRVNALATIGLVILAYAAWMLVGALAGAVAERRPGGAARRVRACVAVLATAGLGAGYLARTEADSRLWNRAAAEQRQLLASTRALLPRLPAGATVYAFDHPAAVGSAGVPVLGTRLDLTSALRLTYGDGSLVGVPISGGAAIVCGTRGVRPWQGGPGGRYGVAFLVDVDRRRAVGLVGREQCDRVIGAGRVPGGS